MKVAKLQYVNVAGEPVEVIGPMDQIFDLAQAVLTSGVATFVMVQDSVASIEEQMDGFEPMIHELTKLNYPGVLR